MLLAELYLPGTDAKGRENALLTIERATTRLAAQRVRLVRSIVVPEDEMCLLLFEADSAETVARVGADSGLVFDRVVEAVD